MPRAAPGAAAQLRPSLHRPIFVCLSIPFSTADDLPSYEFRFETAKLLLELDESVEAASQVGSKV